MSYNMPDDKDGFKQIFRPYRISDIEELRRKADGLVEALESIANNSCCEPCQEAKLVAQQALAKYRGEK